jgi:hypothetical protein
MTRGIIDEIFIKFLRDVRSIDNINAEEILTLESSLKETIKSMPSYKPIHNMHLISKQDLIGDIE